MKVTVDASHPRSAELAERAEQVESHARERLASLDEALALTNEQERRIFPALVRASQSYDPAMTISGGLGRSAAAGRGEALSEDEESTRIRDELDAAQRGELVERQLTDMMLWEEIVDNLVRQLDARSGGDPMRGTASDPAASPSGGASGDVPDSRGGRNLFEDSGSSDQ